MQGLCLYLCVFVFCSFFILFCFTFESPACFIILFLFCSCKFRFIFKSLSVFYLKFACFVLLTLSLVSLLSILFMFYMLFYLILIQNLFYFFLGFTYGFLPFSINKCMFYFVYCKPSILQTTFYIRLLFEKQNITMIILVHLIYNSGTLKLTWPCLWHPLPMIIETGPAESFLKISLISIPTTPSFAFFAKYYRSTEERTVQGHS